MEREVNNIKGRLTVSQSVFKRGKYKVVGDSIYN